MLLRMMPTVQSCTRAPVPESLFYGKLKNNLSSFGYIGDPSPVTGSHPLCTANPSLPQPGFDPVVMSVKTSGWSYCSGQQPTYHWARISKPTKTWCTNPTVPFPRASLSSLISVSMLAQIGTATDVPPRWSENPCMCTR